MAGVIFLVAAGGASAAVRTRLTIHGAFHITTAQAIRGTFDGCGYRATHTLIYGSKALLIGRVPGARGLSSSYRAIEDAGGTTPQRLRHTTERRCRL
jgi:hypothetical protein